MGMAKRQNSHRTGFEKCPIPWKELMHTLFSCAIIKKTVIQKKLLKFLILFFINIGTGLAENIKSNTNPLLYINTTMNNI